VLLAAYNGAEWIAAQIDSIVRQRNVDVDLRIGDDASTDATVAEVTRLATRIDLKLIAARSPSGSAAQNFFRLIRTVELEGHDYVALSDQDDLWQEGKLASACAALVTQGGAGYSCAVTAFWRDGRERVLRQAERRTLSDFLFEGAGQGCTFVLTAALFCRIQRFLRDGCAAGTPLIHYHDWAIYALCRSWKEPWVFDPSPNVRYRQHGANDTGARQSPEGLTKRLRLIRNGWYRVQLEAIARLCRAAAPRDATIARWQDLLALPPGWARRRRIAAFCLEGGRRRGVDRAILVGAALAGWI
jgi:rhamnosyltransferase